MNERARTLNQSASDLYNMFLQEYINFGYAYGGALIESRVCKSFTMDAVNDLLEQNLIQKQEIGDIIRYELTLFEKKKLLEEKNLIHKWSIALGTTLLCDKELTAVYGKTADINQLIHEACHKKTANHNCISEKQNLSL